MRSKCICSGNFYKTDFSQNFDSLICSNCSSRHFVSKNVNIQVEYEYNKTNAKYSNKYYLFGRQFRWAHFELMKLDWTGRKVLEIGCFNGFFLEELRSKGATVYGFDVNLEALKVGKELFGLDENLFSSLSDLNHKIPFDDILFIDLLEHLDAPDLFLKDISALLKPSGRIFVAGPTIERRFHDKSDYPPHHKWWFSQLGLVNCMTQNGFKVENVLAQHNGYLFFRNLIGKIINGINKKEFFGDTLTPNNRGVLSIKINTTLSYLGIGLFKLLGISYCSRLIIAKKVD